MEYHLKCGTCTYKIGIFLQPSPNLSWKQPPKVEIFQWCWGQSLSIVARNEARTFCSRANRIQARLYPIKISLLSKAEGQQLTVDEQFFQRKKNNKNSSNEKRKNDKNISSFTFQCCKGVEWGGDMYCNFVFILYFRIKMQLYSFTPGRRKLAYKL